MDLELAEIIAYLANEARNSATAEIPGFLAVREITSMFHFTSVHNLESLVTNGFLGRESLADRNISFTPSDDYREEPIVNGVCFSLSRPNVYMAARKIQRGQELVLLELTSLNKILTKYNFVVSPGNFGSPALKRKIQSWPEEFVGGKGLMNLFEGEEVRSKYSIPLFEPTDPQSEIIFLEDLPWEYVGRIYFPNSVEYSVSEQIKGIVRKLPKGVVLHSQIKDVFPAIDWRDRSVVMEYNERKWNESWSHSQ
jgi:ssDNA thymidine ADP-ribosyltransferase, DarT